MERKEPYATKEEYKKRVIHYSDVPSIELAPGAKSHIVLYAIDHPLLKL